MIVDEKEYDVYVLINRDLLVGRAEYEVRARQNAAAKKRLVSGIPPKTARSKD